MNSNTPAIGTRGLRAAALLAVMLLAACGSAGVSINRSGAQQAPPGSATLNWTAVTQTTTGAPLTDLIGYKVYYGTSPTALLSVVPLYDPTQTNYVVTDLTPGVWYFGVTAVASDGSESVMSNIESKLISSTT